MPAVKRNKPKPVPAHPDLAAGNSGDIGRADDTAPEKDAASGWSPTSDNLICVVAAYAAALETHVKSLGQFHGQAPWPIPK